MSARPFEKAMAMMRAGDPRSREDGFDFLREHADSYVTELMAEFEREEDGGLRCWLLELIAEARSEQALPLLEGQLLTDDESVRTWAVRGLEMLDTRQSRAVLHRAGIDTWSA
jgi:hypothetical protein